jgi:hypothetical protein
MADVEQSRSLFSRSEFNIVAHFIEPTLLISKFPETRYRPNRGNQMSRM